MNVLKSFAETGNSPGPNSGRRSFLWKTGAAVSAMAASAVAGFSKSSPDPGARPDKDADKLGNQIGRLEDANVIRRLYQAYEACLDKGMYEDVVGMFADDAEVVFNGGVFAGKDKGVRRLYCGHFAPRLIGRKIEPPPDFEPDSAKFPVVIEVAADRVSAACRFPYSIQVGEPMTGNSSLVEMARLHGGGIVKWWEGGICEASCVKSGESWKIRRLEYKTESKADYRPGQTYAKPIRVPAFAKTYPRDPTGPDSLV